MSDAQHIGDLIGAGAIPTDGAFRTRLELILHERGWKPTGKRTREGHLWITPLGDDTVPYKTAVNRERERDLEDERRRAREAQA